MKTYWDVDQFKVWKGLDPVKPQWSGLGFACASWEGANELLSYLERNCPKNLYRVNKR